MKLTVMTWNTLFAGHDGENASRAHTQIAVVNDVRPDVFLMQEAKGFEAGGFARLHQLEHRLGMRGFLSQAPATGQHIAVFIRGRRCAHLALKATARTFITRRRRFALFCRIRSKPRSSVRICAPTALGSGKERPLISRCAPRPSGLSCLAGTSIPPRRTMRSRAISLRCQPFIARYVADDGRLADRAVLSSLENAGWVDLGHALGGTDIPTVPTSGFPNTEFATMRCDYLMATKPLAAFAKTYGVIRTPSTHTASDHYPSLRRST